MQTFSRISTLAAAGAFFLMAAPSCNKKVETPPAAVKPAEPAKPATPPAAPEEPKGLPAPEDVAAAPATAEKTASGLASRVLQPGAGKVKPDPVDLVNVHYTGWTKDGKMFDSSVVRGKPTSFPLNRVIPGWTEGLQLMVEGEKRRFWIPGALAYGDTPARPGAPAGMLVFDVELLGIVKSPKAVPGPIKAPKDVAKAPKNATITPSGISYVVLTKGTGTVHPTAASEVAVIYTGWTLDGKMFDSAAVRGEAAVFPLNGVIPGWTEGVQLMVEGEKTRFWIPGSLAYGETPSRPGAPSGTLVFDVELLKILN